MRKEHALDRQTGIKINGWTIFAASFALALLCMLPFLIHDKGFLVYFGDYNIQQIPFYTQAHRAVRNKTLFMSLQTDLGSSIYTSYSFYLLGSPFFWMTVPFPESAIPYLLPYLLIAKIALAVTAAFLYIRRQTEDVRCAWIGGLLYGFGGTQIVSLVFNHFSEVYAFFPLYIMALEDLAEGKHRGRFAVFTAFMAVLNYYFFTGEAVFLALYTLVRYVICAGERTVRERITCMLRILAEAVIGVMISSVVLLPSLIAVSGNSRVSDTIFDRGLFLYTDWKTYAAILKSMFLPPDIIQGGTLFDTGETQLASLSLYLPLFSVSGVAAYILVNRKKRDYLKWMAAVCAVFALIPGLNALFSGGNAVFYARWYFMILFLMAVMTARAVDSFDQKAFSVGTLIGWAGFAVFLVIGVCSYFAAGQLGEALLIEDRGQYIQELLGSVAGLLFLTYFVWVRRKDRKKRYLNGMCAGTAVVCVLVMYLHISCGRSVVYDEAREIFRQQTAWCEPFTLLDDVDAGFYRTEVSNESQNYPMFWDLPTPSCFLSTVSGSIQDFYEFAGVERKVSSIIPYDRPGLRSLLSIRYYMQNQCFATDPFFQAEYAIPEFEYIGSENSFDVYENRNCLKMGTVFEYYMKRSEYEKLDDIQKDEALLYALVTEDETLQPEETENGLQVQESENGNLQELTAEQLLDMMELSENGMEDRCRTLNETAAKSFSCTDTSMTLEISEAAGGLLFLSVPCSSGYMAFVDGEETEILKVDGGLMAVPVTSGDHTVVFSYREPGILAGGMLSAAGCVLLVLLVAMTGRNRVRRERKAAKKNE